MRRLTYVTGVSCSGKSTTMRAMPTGACTWDIDGGGTPSAGHRDWLRWRAQELLARATPTDDRAIKASESFIFGITWPCDVIGTPAWSDATEKFDLIRWVMLDHPHAVIKARLKERCADQPKAERKALIRYNLDLAGILDDQVSALRYGWVMPVSPSMGPERVARRLMWRPGEGVDGSRRCH